MKTETWKRKVLTEKKGRNRKRVEITHFVGTEADPVATLHGTEEEIERNGNLIAAAPDLLEAAKGLIDWLEQMFPDERLFHGGEHDQSFRMKDLRTAIAKAEGRAE